jgi:hypothetical protein
MPVFEGEDMDVCIYPDLSCGESLHVLVTHDESLFHTNDGRKSGWGPDSEQPLRKKGQGRAIHVSEFLCETLGRLKLSDEQAAVIGNDFPMEARVITHPGKNHDGFWNIEQLVKQVCNKAIYLCNSQQLIMFKIICRLLKEQYPFLKRYILELLLSLPLTIPLLMQHLLLMLFVREP